MKAVLSRINAGMIPALVAVQDDGAVVVLDHQAVEDEVAALAEDVLNWDCGHPMEVANPDPVERL